MRNLVLSPLRIPRVARLLATVLLLTSTGCVMERCEWKSGEAITPDDWTEPATDEGGDAATPPPAKGASGESTSP